VLSGKIGAGCLGMVVYTYSVCEVYV
jgi:hypothetical protein